MSVSPVKGRPLVCGDAVIILPGIMGSELRDSNGRSVWSMGAIGGAWITGDLSALRVTPQERESGTPLLTPTRLIRAPAHLRLWGGLEPYGRLSRAINATLMDPRALLEFPYDWRMSIEYNAGVLVRAAEEHLERWRTTLVSLRREGGESAHDLPDPASVKLRLVAHSMGGLVATYACSRLGLGDVTDSIVTMGTPYYGSVKTVQILATGDGAPAPAAAVRELAHTCPGLYDLLPRYRCVSGAGESRQLLPADVASMGGDLELAQEAAARWPELGVGPGRESGVMIHTVAGIGQPTLQSLSLTDGYPTLHKHLDGRDHHGDSTVYRQAAAPGGGSTTVLHQKHGALPRMDEVIGFVRDKLLNQDAAPPLSVTRCPKRSTPTSRLRLR